MADIRYGRIDHSECGCGGISLDDLRDHLHCHLLEFAERVLDLVALEAEAGVVRYGHFSVRL
jgi:hypothetical protein